MSSSISSQGTSPGIRRTIPAGATVRGGVPRGPGTPSAAGERGIADSARQLTDLVMRAQRQCMPDFSAQLNEAKLSYAQFYLLGMLEDGETLSMGEIAGRMGHSTAAATGLVDRLEKLELVQRAGSPSDRRRVVVAITPHGTAVVRDLKNGMAQTIAQLMAQGELALPGTEGRR